jgi:hypothetical protein
MKKCSICNTYSTSNAEYCSYCGEMFFKPYQLFPEIFNILRSKQHLTQGVVFPLTKNRQLCTKIDEEMKRVEDIRELLKNVKNAEMIQKIENIISTVNGYIESLMQCRVDIEFMKNIISLNAIKDESKRLDSTEIIIYCNGIKTDFIEALDSIRDYYKNSGITEYIKQKIRFFDTAIEELSILLISSILARTSIIHENIGSVEIDFNLLENNIESINHEIDRLSEEVAL